jgi:MiaB-like tRNA modifying enzyme
MRLRFEAYGCALNRGQARELEELAAGSGHATDASESGADLVVLATCTVIQSTENRMLARLRTLHDRGKRVAVAGCMASAQSDLIRKACPDALVLPPRDYGGFLELLLSLGDRGPMPRARRSFAAAAEEIPVADGCRGRCTFCITRLARGRPGSRPVDEVVSRVRTVVTRGCVEVRLAAQDIGLYGQDIGTDLPKLLERVCAVEGNFRVRPGMMNPESLRPIQEGLMAAYAHPKVFKFIHIPVQSGSDYVLERMGRGHSAGDFLEVAERYRKAFPLGLLATDVIVGFPGESEEAFDRTLWLVETSRPDIINIKAFSPRPGTPAFRLKDRPGRTTVQGRIARLQQLRRRVFLENNRRLLGTVQDVLVTEKARRGGVLARTATYHPVILDKALPPGTVAQVRLTGAGTGFLVGEPRER